MTLIIVEGPDLVGKTTAVEKIAKHFKRGFLIKNLYKPKVACDDSIWAQYWKMISFIKANPDSLIIVDRFYQSQVAYSILRGTDDMYHHESFAIESFLNNHIKDVVYVYLSCSEEDLKKRYAKRGDEHVTLKQILEIQKRYDYIFDICELYKIKANTKEKDWLKKIEVFVDGKCK